MELAEQIKKKLTQQLENASFRAYSDITADERQLHGNVNTVVNLSEAKAILLALLPDFVVVERKKLKDHTCKQCSTYLESGCPLEKELLGVVEEKEDRNK